MLYPPCFLARQAVKGRKYDSTTVGRGRKGGGQLNGVEVGRYFCDITRVIRRDAGQKQNIK